MNRLLSTYCVVLSLMITSYYININNRGNVDNYIDKRVVDVVKLSPPPLQVYYYINIYSAKYNVPKEIAFGVARMETGFKDPMNFNYRASQTSNMKAYGAMQVLLSTAKYVSGKHDITENDLLYDIRFNVETSMKMLSDLHNKYHDWNKVLGYYNTGYPVANSYAINIMRNIGNNKL